MAMFLSCLGELKNMCEVADRKLYGGNTCRTQQGAALLVLLLALTVGSSYWLISQLNSHQDQADGQTVLALNIAKEALLSYAVTYPDRNVSRGPGYFLCPDKDNDGDSDLSCSLLGVNPTTGWLPFKTLELPELKDGSGNRLWYALSSQYRNFLSAPLNSEQVSANQLSVDGRNDIVVVIIAAGAPINNQNRDPNVTDVIQIAQHYLEGANKDIRTIDFVTTLGGEKGSHGEYDASGNIIFNDRLVFITQQELMRLVEKRVLGEVKQVLSSYYAATSHYPWLSPVMDEPSASILQAHDGTYEGYIPLFDSNGNSMQSPWFPIWFINNEWHHLITVSYAVELPLPGASPCTAGENCLVFGNANNIRALANINAQVKVIATSP